MEITNKLFENQDIKYQAFTIKLNPTVDPKTIIGVRVPKLRELAKDLIKSNEYEEFLATLPHQYFEENMLHSILLSKIKDYNLLIRLSEKFLPYIDNWAVCDTLRPTYYKSDYDNLELVVYSWIDSNHEFTIRHGIDTLMTYFIKDNFKLDYLDKVSYINDDRYYVQMMIAWFFTESLIHHWDETVPYITNDKLSATVLKMTIRKCLDSHNLNNDKKEYLKELRIKLWNQM